MPGLRWNIGAGTLGLGFALGPALRDPSVRFKVSSRAFRSKLPDTEITRFEGCSNWAWKALRSSRVMAARLAARAQAAETEGRLGDALVAYGSTQDASRSALSLIEGLGDGSIFSSKGARTAPELRRSLATASDAAWATANPSSRSILIESTRSTPAVL
jgi:hypothetical protein